MATMLGRISPHEPTTAEMAGAIDNESAIVKAFCQFGEMSCLQLAARTKQKTVHFKVSKLLIAGVLVRISRGTHPVYGLSSIAKRKMTLDKDGHINIV